MRRRLAIAPGYRMKRLVSSSPTVIAVISLPATFRGATLLTMRQEEASYLRVLRMQKIVVGTSQKAGAA